MGGIQSCTADPATGALTPSPPPAQGTPAPTGLVPCVQDQTTKEWKPFMIGGVQPPASGAPGAPPPAASPPAAAPPAAPAPTPTTTVGGMDGRGILIIAAVVMVLLTIVTFVSTGSFLATLVVIAIMIGIILILNRLGYIKIDLTNGTLNIEYHQTDSAPPPATADQKVSNPLPLAQKEVYYIGPNEYTYEDAPAVCAAYEADLATYDQVNDAYNMGAEWCSYGWSQGAMALYPTQKNTWTALQADPLSRTNCGRPGVNGGYFDPATKFGVNCYGIKPGDQGTMFPLPPPGVDNSAFNAAVNKFKSMMNKMSVNPFNRVGWSEWNLSAHT